MKIELQKKLFKKYPKLFRQRKLPPSETLMCWGIETDEGWFKFIDKLCAKITALDPEVEIVQLKQKYGGLRCCTTGTSKAVIDEIWAAEAESYTICEKCGATGMLRDDLPWMQTLCEECYKKKRKE